MTKETKGKTARKAGTRPTGEHAGHAEGAHHTGAEHAEHTTEDVLHAFRKGRADAIEAAERTLPAVKKSVSKGTYMLCYYLSFGAVYTSELAMSAVPEDSVIRHGLRDGAKAAKEAHAHRHTLRTHHAEPEAAV